MEPGKVVASGWYAANVGDPFAAVENTIAGGPMRRAAARLGPLRGALIFAAARRGRGAALLRLEPGLLTVLALAALTGGPPIVVLELIPHRPPRTRAKRALASLWFRLVERPIYRRGMRAGQALSISEAESLARRYGLEPDRFPVVGWALCRTGLARTPPANARSGVLASGRAACDWETLLAAARPEWDLTVVCSERDADRVRSLGRGRARVLVEISRAEHDRLVSAAAVFAMPLVDDGLSAGQVRLMTATELGTAVVATRVATLAGYTREGATAVLVDPGDPDALRRAVDSLLADPDRRARLARAALDRARARTYAEYFADVRAMVLAAIGDQPRPEGTSSRSE